MLKTGGVTRDLARRQGRLLAIVWCLLGWSLLSAASALADPPADPPGIPAGGTGVEIAAVSAVFGYALYRWRGRK